MIGKVPKGAPLRCRLGRHIGKEQGGLMAYQCKRCGGTYWQDRDDYRAVLPLADAAIVRGDRDAAREYLRTIGREDLLDQEQ